MKRIQIVGSVRRQKKAGVHDIELLCIPEPGTQTDLFGALLPGNMLDENIERKAREWHAKLLVNGPMTKRMVLPEGPKLEIYISTPGRWGVEMVIKTGDAEFSKLCVTQRVYRGFLPNDSVIKDGWQVYRNGTRCPMLEEADFLEYIGFPGDLDPVIRSGALLPK
jgi:hypothetical protein